MPSTARVAVILLCDFSGIELDQHRSVRFHLFQGDRQAEVVQEQELKLEVIEFNERKTTNLRTLAVVGSVQARLVTLAYLELV